MGKKAKSKPKVAVVDGDAGFLEKAKSWLMAKYDVFPFLSGAKTVEELNKIEPDLLILDTSTPDKSKAECRKRILADSRLSCLPRLFLVVPHDDVENPELAGEEPDACLKKPVNGQILHEKLQEFLSA
jgi:DNA-binding response OmpR family regulator